MLKRIINYIKGKKAIVKTFERYSIYLTSGEYAFDDSLLYIYLCNDIVPDRANEILSNNYEKVMLRKSVFWRSINYFVKKLLIKNSYTVNNEDNKPDAIEIFFKGNILLPGTNGKDIKIFDVYTNRILCIYFDEEDYAAKLGSMQGFKEFFPIPAIIDVDPSMNCFTQEFIDFRQKDTWTHEDYIYVFENTIEYEIAYIQACEKSGSYCFKSLKALTDNFGEKGCPAGSGCLADSSCLADTSCLAGFIRNKLDDTLFNYEFPYVSLHGDLWTSNILLTRDNPAKTYYIDWETSGRFIFFYDLLFLILNECMIHDNYIYMEKYLKGDFDIHFQKVFRIFHMDFDRNLRAGYLFVCLFNQYLDRWTAVGKKTEKKILNKWKKVLRKAGL